MTTCVYVEIREPHMVKVVMKNEGEGRKSRLLSTGCCLGCERKLEKNEPICCGQCLPCYQASRAKIRDNKVRVNDLIALGYMLPPRKAGRKPKTEYTRKLAEM